MRSSKAAVLFAALLLLAAAPAATAQDSACGDLSDFPCGYQLEQQALKRAPALFRLQARVAQAGVQIGEANFEKVMVKVLRGTEVLCREQFRNVHVLASVMNLEIGQEIDCEIDEVMARNTDLELQICIGTDETCLPPIPLSSTPYAVRATWAYESERVHKADRAGQAHYAHRFTADRDLLERETLGTGYFDVETPTAAEAAALYDEPGFADYEDSGFLQWTPVRNREAMTLHLAGKHHRSDRLRDLKDLALSTRLTRATGDLRVQPRSETGLTVRDRGAHVTGASDVDAKLLVTGTVTAEQNADVALEGNVGGELMVGAGAHVSGANLAVTGESVVDGHLLVKSATTVTGGAQVSGDSSVLGVCTVTGANPSAVVSEDLSVLGEAEWDAAHVTGAASATTSLEASSAEVTAGASTKDLDVEGRLDVEGGVLFTKLVTFRGGRSTPGEAANTSFVQFEDEDRAIAFGGLVQAADGAGLGADMDGGMNKLVGARLELAASAPHDCDTSTEGLTYIDMSLHQVRLCTGGKWKVLGGGGGGFICGNGFVQETEGCDDGNADPGDGCAPDCQVEAGWVCPPGRNCKPDCGDGVITGDEECDDGNVSQDDGCTALCRISQGWECEGATSVCTVTCGDGLVRGDEGCDDGGTEPGDGCTPECEVMSGWYCGERQPSICQRIPLAVPGYEGVNGPDMSGDGLALCGGAGPEDLGATGKDFYALCEGYSEIVFACSVGDDDEAELVSAPLPTDGVVLSDEACDDWPGAASSPFAGDHVLAVDQSDPGCGDYDNSYEMYVHFGVQWACMGTNTTPGYLGQTGGRVWAFVRYP